MSKGSGSAILIIALAFLILTFSKTPYFSISCALTLFLRGIEIQIFVMDRIS